jgi:raffinose/stachyose/melibiose transport system substrate-binding protein
MKRRVVFLVVGLLALTTAALPCFAGGQQATGTMAGGQPVKLTVWGRDVTDGAADHAYVTALVRDFKAKYPDIQLDYVHFGEDLNNKIKVAMSAGSGLPDIIQSWGGRMMGDFVDHGKLLDLTNELKKIPGSAAAQAAMTWKGKIYGVAPFFAIAGIFQNDGIFQRLGLKDATTIEEVARNADKLLAAGIQPFAAGGKDKWPVLHLYMYFVDRFGGSNAFSDAADRKTHFYGEPFIQAANYYQGWVKKGYFGSKPLGEAYGDAQQLMASGKAAMQLTGSWMCANFSDPTFTKEKLSFHQFPAFASGGKGPATDVMGMTDIGWAATMEAKNKRDAVVKFMTYSMSPEAGQFEPGRVASMPGVEAKNPLTTQASAVFSKATYVEFWWDQNLPAAATTPVNDVVQIIFLPNGDVKKALQDFDRLMDDAVGPVK